MIERTSGPTAASLIERMPPHSSDAEMALLGSILLDGEVMGFVAPILQPEDFYRAANGRLFEVMQELYDRGEPVDVLLVRRECERRSILEQVGDDFLAQLATVVATPAHAEHYAQIVREKAIARALIATATEIQQAAYADEAGGEDLLEMAESRVCELGDRREVGGDRDVKSLLTEAIDELDRTAGPA